MHLHPGTVLTDQLPSIRQMQAAARVLLAARHSRPFEGCRLAGTLSSACACLETGGERPSSKVQQLFNERQVLTLERGTGSNAGKDSKLWGTGSFNAGVYPDLPAFMKWSDLLDINKVR
jgi:hypothetical protein